MKIFLPGMSSFFSGKIFFQGAFTSLQRIDLRGCQLLSDVGLSWLSDLIAGASKLVDVSTMYLYTNYHYNITCTNSV